VEYDRATHHVGGARYDWLCHDNIVRPNGLSAQRQESAPQCAFDDELQTPLLLRLTNTLASSIPSITDTPLDRDRARNVPDRLKDQSPAARIDKTKLTRFDLPGSRVGAAGASTLGNSALLKTQSRDIMSLKSLLKLKNAI
jgi:hypothetical protein